MSLDYNYIGSEASDTLHRIKFLATDTNSFKTEHTILSKAPVDREGISSLSLGFLLSAPPNSFIGYGMAVFGDYIYCFAGASQSDWVDSVDRYSITTDTWDTLPCRVYRTMYGSESD